MLKRISKKIGFTETEIKVILFLIIFLIVGYGYRAFTTENPEENITFFDYSEQDSIFYQYSKINQKLLEAEETSTSLAQIREEVLGISEEKWQTQKKPLPEENSINLNTADLDELTRLPGIGIKTAEKIIELRDSRGGFNSIEELKNVKGIGEVKFNNVKKFLYIK
jgi:competence protein ComEA